MPTPSQTAIALNRKILSGVSALASFTKDQKKAGSEPAISALTRPHVSRYTTEARKRRSSTLLVKVLHHLSRITKQKAPFTLSGVFCLAMLMSLVCVKRCVPRENSNPYYYIGIFY